MRMEVALFVGVGIHKHMCVSAWACVCVRACVHLFVCVFVCVCVSVFAHVWFACACMRERARATRAGADVHLWVQDPQP